MRKILLLFPFYRRGNRGTERLSRVPRASEMSQEVEMTMLCHRMVEFNDLSSLSWRLREEEMGSWLRWSCRYLGRGCASPPRGLSHPPVSKYPGPGFPMTWLSPPLPQVHLCEPGRGHHPVQLCLLSVLDTHLALVSPSRGSNCS